MRTLYNRLYSEVTEKGRYGGRNPRAKYFLQFIRQAVTKDKTILDAGCGRGHLLKRLIEDGYNAVGTEICDYLLSHDLAGFPVTLVSYQAMDPEEMGFYDVVISSDVLEHLPFEDVEPAVKKLASMAGEFLLISVSTRAAHNPLPDSPVRNLHLTVRPKEWWMALINRYAEIFSTFRAARSLFIFGRL